MKTLKLSLSGPMQSYGTDQRHRYRTTEDRPTRSAVVGLLACALGRDRSADISDLETLDINIEAPECTGTIETDFQTIQDCISYNGDTGRNEITHRQYLTESTFDVSVAGDDAMIDQLAHAVQFPRWQLYLGRRANVPTRPVFSDVE